MQVMLRVLKLRYKGGVKVTIEEAKKELKDYLYNLKYIQARQEDTIEIRTRLESTTKRLGFTLNGKGPNLDNDALTNGIDRINEIEKDCDTKLQELLLTKYIVENKIEQLQQPYKSILYIRYIRGRRMHELSEELGLEYKYTCRLHGDALRAYASIS